MRSRVRSRLRVDRAAQSTAPCAPLIITRTSARSLPSKGHINYQPSGGARARARAHERAIACSSARVHTCKRPRLARPRAASVTPPRASPYFDLVCALAAFPDPLASRRSASCDLNWWKSAPSWCLRLAIALGFASVVAAPRMSAYACDAALCTRTASTRDRSRISTQTERNHIPARTHRTRTLFVATRAHDMAASAHDLARDSPACPRRGAPRAHRRRIHLHHVVGAKSSEQLCVLARCASERWVGLLLLVLVL